MGHFLSFAGEFVNTPNSHHPFSSYSLLYDLDTYTLLPIFTPLLLRHIFLSGLICFIPTFYTFCCRWVHRGGDLMTCLFSMSTIRSTQKSAYLVLVNGGSVE